MRYAAARREPNPASDPRSSRHASRSGLAYARRSNPPDGGFPTPLVRPRLSRPFFELILALWGLKMPPAPPFHPKIGLGRRCRPPAIRPECPASRETRGHLLNGGLPARRGLRTAPCTVPTAQSAPGLGAGLWPAAVWSLNTQEFLTAPGLDPRSHASPPFRLSAREIPALVARKTVVPYAAPEAGTAKGTARLRRAPFFSASRSVARYDSHGAPRAPLNSLGEQPENPLKRALKPSFPQCGNILSIVWKNPEIVFHSVWKTLRAAVPDGVEIL